MVECLEHGTVRYVQDPHVGRHEFITHAFCTRKGGASRGRFARLNFSTNEGDTEEAVRANWDILAQAFRIPFTRFVTVCQIHGDGVLVIDTPYDDRRDPPRLEYDAIVTNEPDLAIGVKTADCVPVLLVDIVRRVIGVVHAGWQGTALHIVAGTVSVMQERFSSATKDIEAVIGPAIGPCCYEVDEVVRAKLQHAGPWNLLAVESDRCGHWMLDLPGANYLQLVHAGIPPQNISLTRLCTSCNKDLFFSHRGEGGRTGRQLSFIMLNAG